MTLSTHDLNLVSGRLSSRIWKLDNNHFYSYIDASQPMLTLLTYDLGLAPVDSRVWF